MFTYYAAHALNSTLLHGWGPRGRGLTFRRGVEKVSPLAPTSGAQRGININTFLLDGVYIFCGPGLSWTGLLCVEVCGRARLCRWGQQAPVGSLAQALASGALR